MVRTHAFILFCLFLSQLYCAAAEENAATQERGRIPVFLNKPANLPVEQWPVTFGIPFPKGLLQDAAALQVVDEKGNAVPAQFVASGHWPDGSMRWALADFSAEFSKKYFVSWSGPKTESARPPAVTPEQIRIDQSETGISVSTGPAQYTFRKGHGCFDEIRLDFNGDGQFDPAEEALLTRGGLAFYAEDSQGRTGILQASELKVELEGQRHAVIRIEGEYRDPEGRRNAAAVAYFHFYAGYPQVRVSHKLIVTEDAASLWFRDLGLALRLTLEGTVTATLQNDHGKPESRFIHPLEPGRELVMLQEDFPHFGSTASRFSITEISAGTRKELQAGAACGEWADVSSTRWGLAVQLPAFAEQFPKAFRAARDRLIVKLWASESGQELDYRTPKIIKNYFGHDWIPENDPCTKVPNVAQGTSKTHEMWIFPHSGGMTQETASRLGGSREEIFAAIDPQWLAQSGIMGAIHPKDLQRFPQAEKAIEDHFDRAVLAGNKVFPAAGYLYWGMYPYSAQSWEQKNGRWYPTLHRLARCLEYNLKRSVWVLYGRSGERKYYDYARRYTRLLHNLIFSSWDVPSKPKGWMVQGFFHSPIIWGQFENASHPPVMDSEGACLSYASSEDIIQFVYDYFLTGDFHSRDMARLWTEAMIQEMNFDVDKALKFYPPSAFFRVLASAYELDQDPRLLDYGSRIMDRLILANGQHILNPEIPQNYGKEGEVFSGFYYYWVATGDVRVKKALVELAKFRYRQAYLDGFFSRASCMLQAFSLAYEETGDRAYSDYLAQAVSDFGRRWVTLGDMGVDLAGLNQHSKESWGQMILTSQSAIHIGIPAAERVIAASGLQTPDLPLATKKHPTQRTYLMVEKENPGQARIDLFVNNWGERNSEPRLVDERGQEHRIEILDKDYHRITKPDCFDSNSIWYLSYEDQIFFRLCLPDAVPPGLYHLDLGREVNFTVLNSEVGKIFQIAPEGIVLEPGRRYYFRLPPQGVEAAEFFSMRPIRVFDAEGKEVACESVRPARYRFSFSTGGKTGIWSLETASDKFFYGKKIRSGVESFVRMETFPLVIAQENPQRLAEVNVSAFVAPYGLPEKPLKTEEANAFVESRPGFGQALKLAGSFVEISVPPDGQGPTPSDDEHDPEDEAEEKSSQGQKPLLPREQGTVEYWFSPLWSATDCSMVNLGDSTHRMQYYSWEPVSLSYSVDPDNGGRTGRYNLAFLHMAVQGAGFSRARIYFESGRWYHIALTWHVDGKNSACDIYINGRKKAYSHYVEGMPLNASPAKLPPPGPSLRFGSGRTTGNLSARGAVFDEFRVSRTVRYQQDFEPQQEAFQPDGDTCVLLHLDGDLTGTCNGLAISGKIVQNSRLW